MLEFRPALIHDTQFSGAVKTSISHACFATIARLFTGLRVAVFYNVPKMQIRLLRKLSSVFNSVDLSNVRVGEVIELPEYWARMVVRAEWAGPVPNRRREEAAFDAHTQ